MLAPGLQEEHEPQQSQEGRPGRGLGLKEAAAKNHVGWLEEEWITLTLLLLEGVSQTVVLQHRKVSTHWKKISKNTQIETFKESKRSPQMNPPRLEQTRTETLTAVCFHFLFFSDVLVKKMSETKIEKQ